MSLRTEQNVEVGLRPLAAKLEQAPTLACPSIIEALGKESPLEERQPRTPVVDRLAVEGGRPFQRIELGKLTEDDDMGEGRAHRHRDRRATRNIR